MEYIYFDENNGISSNIYDVGFLLRKSLKNFHLKKNFNK